MIPRSALRRLVDAAAARWHLEAGETRQAEELIAALARWRPGAHAPACPPGPGPRPPRCGAGPARRASLATMRDRLTGELLLARAAIESGDDAAAHVTARGRARGPRAPGPGLPRRGPAVARLARAAAESLGTEACTRLSVALGAPSPVPQHSRASRRRSSPTRAVGAAVHALLTARTPRSPANAGMSVNTRQVAPEEASTPSWGFPPARRRSSGPGCSACCDEHLTAPNDPGSPRRPGMHDGILPSPASASPHRSAVASS